MATGPPIPAPLAAFTPWSICNTSLVNGTNKDELPSPPSSRVLLQLGSSLRSTGSINEASFLLELDFCCSGCAAHIPHRPFPPSYDAVSCDISFFVSKEQPPTEAYGGYCSWLACTWKCCQHVGLILFEARRLNTLDSINIGHLISTCCCTVCRLLI